jgi:hypothetical protein
VATDLEDVERVRKACPRAQIFIGSGIVAETVADYLRWADGVIVGSSLKRKGRLAQPVDERRVARLAKIINRGG